MQSEMFRDTNVVVPDIFAASQPRPGRDRLSRTTLANGRGAAVAASEAGEAFSPAVEWHPTTKKAADTLISRLLKYVFKEITWSRR